MGSFFALLGCALFGSCEELAPSSVGYTITLVNTGTITRFDALFRRAAARWEEVIVGDLTDITSGISDMDLFSGELSQTSRQLGITRVDDLVIGYEFRVGVGLSTVTRAGPTFIRDDRTPLAGVMVLDPEFFDTRTVDAQYLSILYSMGQVLGIGSLWRNAGCSMGCASVPDEPLTLSVPYSCPQAAAAYDALRASTGNAFGLSPLQVTRFTILPEVVCISWLRRNFDDARWDELMTLGVIGGGGEEKPFLLTTVTIATLRDISPAYQTNDAAADPIPRSANQEVTWGISLSSEDLVQARNPEEFIVLEPKFLSDYLTTPP